MKKSYLKKIIAFALMFVAFNAGIFSAEEKLSETEKKSTQLNSTQLKSAEEKMMANAQVASSSKDYLVTAGDIYQLAFAAGSSKVTYPIIVDPSYSIKVANLGNLNARGYTFVELKKQVEEIVNKNYPMSGVLLTIVSPATFKVTLVGEVVSTTEPYAWGMMRLSSVLNESILTEFSSLRNVEVVSKSGKSATYDLFRAKRDGDLSQDPYLRPDDTIKVRRYDRKVVVSGAVERPGSYELLKGENIKELINIYGGGLKDRADTSRIEINRTYDVVHSSGRKIYTDEKAIEDNFELLNCDSVYIASYYDLRKVVFFEGAVYISDDDKAGISASNKVPVYVEDEENYAFLVRRMQSLFSSVSDIERAYIRRGSEIIPINLKDVLYNPESFSFETIKNYDTLMIPFKQSFVTVAGSVNKPGRYPYIPDRSWDYYIGLAGGFVKSENAGSVISIRDINGVKLSKKDAITPECTITASTNSFTYYFNMYAPIVTTTLTTISTILAVIAVTK